MAEQATLTQVTLTVNGQQIQAAPGTLLIEAAKKAGIEIPAFCYYEGYSLQAACRMCLVEVEKMPKLQPGCTLPVAEGMVIHTESPKVVEARKSTLEFLLTNHPLDCPVCDKGGECELQDMVFRYGAGESRFTEIKHHTPEKQWSPMVYFDAPRCILCYRCVRVCDEGLGVNALGVVNRGVISEIAPNKGDHLDCDECGACIDICPVGALTSGTYRYQSRPWEMNHVGTICTHCSNGCKTTLSIRNGEIKRANNRDRSGINDEFLCVKGRFGYDFVGSEERLQSPMIRRDGVLTPASWSEALALVASKLAAAKAKGGAIAVSASTRTTNEENFYLQKLLRDGLGSNHIDHHRTGDVATLIDALAGKTEALATVGDLYTAKGALVIGADLAQQHPLLAFQLRANYRHHGAKVFTVTPGAVRERDYAAGSLVVEESRQMEAVESLRDSLAGLESVVIAFGSSVRGEDVRKLVAFGESLGGRVKYIPLVEYSNSRGALDMGLVPDLLPGYQPAGKPGMTLPRMLAATELDVFWAVGSNPLEHADLAAKNAFVVVQDLFLTETAKKADVVLPAASAYEKSGTVTNTCGEVQRLKHGAKVIGVKPDLEIFGLLGKELGLQLGIWTPDKVFEEIRRTVKGYNVALPVIATGGAAQSAPLNGRVAAIPSPELIQPANDTLFTSGTLSRYSKMLNAPMEAPGQLYKP
jgi:NADH-quinone oxidoreductase subunit G